MYKDAQPEMQATALQKKLSRLLYTLDDPHEIKNRLMSDPELTPYRNYIESFEIALLNTIARSVKSWHQPYAGTTIIEPSKEKTTETAKERV